MRVINVRVFDDVISGTASTWLSGSEFNSSIGQADAFSVQAVTSGVTGAGPTLTISLENSSDGQNWLLGDAYTNAISEGTSVVISKNPLRVYAALVRVRVALGGTTPGCRLKLYVTGRPGALF